MGASVSFFSKKNEEPINNTNLNDDLELKRSQTTLNSASNSPHHPSTTTTSNQQSSSSSLQLNTTFEKPPTSSTRNSSRNNSFHKEASTSLSRQNSSNLSDFHNHIPHTPVCSTEKEIYKYYCPLCMEYYKKILKSSLCCSQYICFSCSLSYFDTKLLDFNEIKSPSYFLKYKHLLESIACPHCNNNGFVPVEVSETEDVKDYTYKIPEVSNGDNERDLGDQMKPSPLKIGESFENMKRKMIPFQINRSNSNSTKLASKNGIAIDNEEQKEVEGSNEEKKEEEVDLDNLFAKKSDESNFDEVNHLLPIFTSTINKIEDTSPRSSRKEEENINLDNNNKDIDENNNEKKDIEIGENISNKIIKDSSESQKNSLEYIDRLSTLDPETPMLSTRVEESKEEILA